MNDRLAELASQQVDAIDDVLDGLARDRFRVTALLEQVESMSLRQHLRNWLDAIDEPVSTATAMVEPVRYTSTTTSDVTSTAENYYDDDDDVRDTMMMIRMMRVPCRPIVDDEKSANANDAVVTKNPRHQVQEPWIRSNWCQRNSNMSRPAKMTLETARNTTMPKLITTNSFYKCLLIVLYRITLGQGRSIQFVNPVKLTTTITTTHGANLVIGKPTHHVMGMSTVLATHTPTKPFGEGKIGRRRQIVGPTRGSSGAGLEFQKWI